MKKNLIAIIALTAALAASTSAFADTVQISEEELNKPVSTYARMLCRHRKFKATLCF